MAIQFATQAQALIQYDGSNAQELVDFYSRLSGTEAEIDFENDGAAHVTVVYWEGGGGQIGIGFAAPYSLELNTGDWVLLGSYSVIPGSEFALKWIVKT